VRKRERERERTMLTCDTLSHYNAH
jgi:hypothetical protein